uniref:Uncharacterized protein n=1 Tax=viral metagenome TaxID=1070528 RepID=A0A6C0HS82_9ZZZZ
MIKKVNKNSIKNVIKNNNNIELDKFINEKILYLQEIIRNTIISIKSNNNKIFSNNDIILSITILNELYEKTIEVKNTENLKKINQNIKNDQIKAIEELQKITDKLLMIICGFGTKNIEDLLYISFGFEFNNIKIENPILNAKYELIKKHIHPIGCKIINWKPHKLHNNNSDIFCSNKITDEILVFEDADSFECFDTDKSTESFYQKIFGIRIVIHNEIEKKTIIISGIVDNIELECFSNEYIDFRKDEIKKSAEEYEKSEKEIILRILESFNLKEILVFGNEDLQKKMMSIIIESTIVKQSKLDNTIKKFIDLDAYSQRNMLINLLIYSSNDEEIQYLCYILYDLVSSSNNNNSEFNDQQYIFDSLPSKIKKYFKDVKIHYKIYK